MFYQLGWTTLPGLRGLACSEFRATPASFFATAERSTAPASVPGGRVADNILGDRTAIDERGVAIEFASDAERDEFLRQLEEHFAARWFTNTADAFDTVKVYVLERAASR